MLIQLHDSRLFQSRCHYYLLVVTREKSAYSKRHWLTQCDCLDSRDIKYSILLSFLQLLLLFHHQHLRLSTRSCSNCCPKLSKCCRVPFTFTARAAAEELGTPEVTTDVSALSK